MKAASTSSIKKNTPQIHEHKEYCSMLGISIVDMQGFTISHESRLPCCIEHHYKISPDYHLQTAVMLQVGMSSISDTLWQHCYKKSWKNQNLCGNLLDLYHKEHKIKFLGNHDSGYWTTTSYFWCLKVAIAESKSYILPIIITPAPY